MPTGIFRPPVAGQVFGDVYRQRSRIQYRRRRPVPPGRTGVGYTTSPSGAITPTGALHFAIVKSVSGSITPAGTVGKAVSKSFAGGITPEGALTTLKIHAILLSGSITPAGAVVLKTTKALAGSITPSGTVVKAIARTFAGSITPAGTVGKRFATTFSGSVASAGSLRKRIGKGLTGSITPSGTLATVLGPLRVVVAAVKKFLVHIGLKEKYDVDVGIALKYAVAVAPALKYAAAIAIAPKYEVEITVSNETCYVGNAIVATLTFTTVSSGALTDPTTVTAKTEAPGGVKTSYTYGVDASLTKSSTGVYLLTFTPDSAGVWTVQGAGTGTAVAVNQDTFNVLAAI